MRIGEFELNNRQNLCKCKNLNIYKNKEYNVIETQKRKPEARSATRVDIKIFYGGNQNG